MKWHWSTWIQAKLSRCGHPHFSSLAVPRPFFFSDRDCTTHECWSAGLEMWGGVLLGPLWPWCWLNVARKRSSGSNRRTARLHCPAELSTDELWTLTLFCRLSLLLSILYLSAWVGQVTHSCAHMTHLLFYEHTDVLYSPVVHASPLLYMFCQIFYVLFLFCFFYHISCLWHLCLAFLSSVDDSCHFHFCGECDIWLMWLCFILITVF